MTTVVELIDQMREAVGAKASFYVECRYQAYEFRGCVPVSIVRTEEARTPTKVVITFAHDTSPLVTICARASGLTETDATAIEEIFSSAVKSIRAGEIEATEKGHYRLMHTTEPLENGGAHQRWQLRFQISDFQPQGDSLGKRTAHTVIRWC
ncbi:hypothetical protein ACFL0L_01175 [Patescibacteria group bacterium]